MHGPLATADNGRYSSSTGFVDRCKHEITCDDTKHMREAIVYSMDNMVFNDVKIKKANQVKTLADVSCMQLSGTKKLPLDSMVLFSHLLLTVQHSSDKESYFNHERTAVPTSFIKPLMHSIPFLGRNFSIRFILKKSHALMG
jgi:hypothetical protein